MGRSTCIWLWLLHGHYVSGTLASESSLPRIHSSAIVLSWLKPTQCLAKRTECIFMQQLCTAGMRCPTFSIPKVSTCGDAFGWGSPDMNRSSCSCAAPQCQQEFRLRDWPVTFPTRSGSKGLSCIPAQGSMCLSLFSSLVEAVYKHVPGTILAGSVQVLRCFHSLYIYIL